MNQAGRDILEYYIDHANERFDKLEKKVDRLWDLKMMLLGACLVVSGVCSIAVNVVLAYLKVV